MAKAMATALNAFSGAHMTSISPPTTSAAELHTYVSEFHMCVAPFCASEHLSASHGLTNHVTFWGHIDDATKELPLARAHDLVMTSLRERWGLAATEANAVGTPAVVYDAPGLHDSTLDRQTGLVCKQNTPWALARAILSLYQNRAPYARLRHQTWTAAKQLSWDETAHAARCAVVASAEC
jgi:glycosyltransferase involved in cell wall biosynthesis